MKKIIAELKWLLVSVLLVASVIGLVIGTANFCQWRVGVNMVRVEAGEIQVVEYTRWGE